MGSIINSPPAREPLSAVIPPLILGTATFNTQYVSDPKRMPYASIVERALSLGVSAFDTSPYYGPSEILLGNALHSIEPRRPRDSYFLVTKAGRIASAEFDYSPAWISYSVCRSLESLHTSYLDLVYTHDVEFVSPDEVVVAVRELRRLRDAGYIRYVGISGYPVSLLCDLSEKILRETGEPLDAVLSYSHFCVQNSTLGRDDILRRFKNAGVSVVLNASMLSMGLLTTRGADEGPMATWHPAPGPLRKRCQGLASIAAKANESLEDVALHWAMDNWARIGASLGGKITHPSANGHLEVGVSVMGVTKIEELEETWRAWQDVVKGLLAANGAMSKESLNGTGSRLEKIHRLVEEQMWPALGEWRDYSWASPEDGFVNQRSQFGVIPDDETAVRWAKLKVRGATDNSTQR